MEIVMKNNTLDIDSVLKDKKNVTGYQRKALSKGRSKSLRLYEKAALKVSGWRDARKDMPTEDVEGSWTTSFIQWEISRAEESCGRIWSESQIRCDSMYVGVQTIMNDIEQKFNTIKAALKELAELRAETAEDLTTRKRGEEDLADAQIKIRRKRENDALTAPIKRKIDSLKEQINRDYECLFILLNNINEAVNASKLVSDKISWHTVQRVNVYWESLRRHHKDKNKLPSCVDVPFVRGMEAVYSSQHERISKIQEENLKRSQQMMNEISYTEVA